jgi:hypothetical protein
MPKLSFSTFASGARQLVVQEPFEMTWWVAPSYSSWFTPSTSVLSWFFAGALMITFRAPAAMCVSAFDFSVNSPVHSSTMSTPSCFQGSSFGSLSASTWISWPFTTTPFVDAATSHCGNVRWTLS